MRIKSQDGYYIVSAKDDYIISIEHFSDDARSNIFIRTSLSDKNMLLGAYTREKAERVMMEIDDAIRIGYDYWMPKEEDVYVPYL